MKRLLITFLVLSLPIALNAQLAGTPPPGPVSMALAGVSSPLSNSWSVFNNPAGLAGHEKFDAVFAYQTIFDFAPFNTVSAAINYPASFGNSSIGVYRFGDELFSTTMLSAGFGKKIGIVSLGMKINYLQYSIDGFGKKAIGVAEMGAIGELLPSLTFGMHIYNFTQSVISESTGEKVPVIIRLSANYELSKQVDLYLEGEKDIDEDADVKFGLSYKVIEELVLRTGFSTETNRMTFGAGINISRITVDYALRANETISATHNFGLTYRFTN